MNRKKVCVLAAVVKLVVMVGIGFSAFGESKKDKIEMDSITVYPILLGEKHHKNVAQVVGLFLEKAGLQSIEIAETIFPPKPRSLDVVKKELGSWVRNHPIQTQMAIYGEYLGSPKSGVKAVRMVVADKAGNIIWSDEQTPKMAEFKKVNPKNPMTCTVLLVDRLRSHFDLQNPYRKNAPEGKMAQLWKEKSNVPADEEIKAMKSRLKKLKKELKTAKITVFPFLLGEKAKNKESAVTFIKEIENKNICQLVGAKKAAPITVQGRSNELRMLWTLAHAFGDYIKQHPVSTKYALIAHFLIDEKREHVGAVHFVLVNQKGEFVA
ncbi:hypothetical protein GF373_06115, partial [bacterium]|nr:hypothetical protein [bacterium]